MNVPSWAKWLGIVVALAGVAASPAYGDLVPQVVANVLIVAGAIAAALSRGVSASTGWTWTGLVIAALSVFAEPTVAGIVGAKWAQLAGLLGAILAAVGAAVPKGNA